MKGKQGWFVESLDGSMFHGEDATDIVDQMRRKAWGGQRSSGLRGYMKQVAKRVLDWNGEQVRINSCVKFLEDLAAAGIITIDQKGARS